MASGTGSQVIVTRPFPDFAVTFAGGAGSSSSAAIESPAPHSPWVPSMVRCVRSDGNISLSSQVLIMIWWCILLLKHPVRKTKGLSMTYNWISKFSKAAERESRNRMACCGHASVDRYPMMPKKLLSSSKLRQHARADTSSTLLI